jgi:cbb3-type cytochrome oxidase subunit 3
VKDKYTEVGTGIATGLYQGEETIFVAQVYANPLIAQAEPQVKIVKTEVKKDIPTQTETTPTVAVEQKAPEESNVLGAEVSTQEVAKIATPKISILQKALASPRNTNKTILSIIFGVVFIALILYIFIKRRNHHIDIITNGLIVLAIIGAIFSANYYLSHRSMVVYQNLDYSNESK